ncbi:F0F1 ATP synthase subunit A [Corynebacterium caspium]|uniref:F0F1 ATP synthase subunit A n=1 Tax=Corynebacterium caspium TaxID=234828 RepID=UPI000475DE02|nr:F0F1 ATP synthase subunit A [Corynebacterium caspium]WKD59452.1 ATP synthase subunit a [Corynebacterium caspium DSM 44850]
MKGEFHSPDLDSELFPGHVTEDGTVVNMLFHDVANGWFALDRLMLIRIFMTLIVVALFAIGMRNPKLVPSGFQNVIETAIDFVRIHIAEDILGKQQGRRFLPVIATIFFTVIAFNIPTIIPGLNISPNARIGMPAVLALFGFCAFVYAGVRRYGAFKYFKSSVVIPNLPFVLHLLVVPIEILSTFIIRPVTLALRLMSNFLAGHIILVLLYSATNFFFFQLNGWTAVSGVTLLAGIAFTAYECIIIVLQAYIFALLVAVYIDMSLNAADH